MPVPKVAVAGRAALSVPTPPLKPEATRLSDWAVAAPAFVTLAVTVTESKTGQKLGIATDLGRPTAAVRHALRRCDLLILESNHDEILLRESPYPWSVKTRIASSHGHLSNRAAAELVADLSHPALAGVVLAHLSGKANDPHIAEDTVGQALERLRFVGDLQVGRQSEPLPPIEISSLRNRIAPTQLSLL